MTSSADQDDRAESGTRQTGQLPQDARASGRLPTGFTLAAGIVLLLLLWQLSGVLVLVFCSILIAAVLWSAADVIERHTPLNALWSKILSWFLIGVMLVGFLLLMGAQIGMELANLIEALPGLIADLGALAGIENLSAVLSEQAQEVLQGPEVLGVLASYTTGFMGGLGTLLLVFFGGVFLAVDPATYRKGLTSLLPTPWDARTGEAMDEAGGALSRWLLGKVIAMIVIGVVTTIGLMLIGVPSALALGVVAGLFEFVPIVGPVLSAVPALLVAIPEGIDKAVWVLVLYVGLQQVESNVLVPVIQQHTAKLPPVLGLFAIVALGSLFGLIGMIVAAPLALVVMVLVKRLYVGDMLGRDVERS